VHCPGEQNLTVEELVAALRQKKLRVGVVVDEAHHGFFGTGVETQAMRFFRETLQPEYTVLVTATPDDSDIQHFKESLSIERLNRITISRREPVEEGLVKEGIKCAAYFALPGQEALVDYEEVALRDGVTLHNRLKEELRKLRVSLTPLMLVQVDSTAKSVERARERLLALGFNETQIAVHTADEPDSGLLALANDETREVLVFKMAVALGFDAPRASTLVSMRAARDEDFGVQIVGFCGYIVVCKGVPVRRRCRRRYAMVTFSSRTRKRRLGLIWRVSESIAFALNTRRSARQRPLFK